MKSEITIAVALHVFDDFIWREQNVFLKQSLWRWTLFSLLFPASCYGEPSQLALGMIF